MMGVIFLVLLVIAVAGLSWLEMGRRKAQVKAAVATVKAAKVAKVAAEAEDKRRDEATVSTAIDMSATVEAKRGSSPRPRSKVLDELR